MISINAFSVYEYRSEEQVKCGTRPEPLPVTDLSPRLHPQPRAHIAIFHLLAKQSQRIMVVNYQAYLKFTFCLSV